MKAALLTNSSVDQNILSEDNSARQTSKLPATWQLIPSAPHRPVFAIAVVVFNLNP
ncbi:hypothetical protein HK405_012201, partial [Cladochytrium tenue]